MDQNYVCVLFGWIDYSLHMKRRLRIGNLRQVSIVSLSPCMYGHVKYHASRNDRTYGKALT